jgi:hypothetical protein
MKPEKENLIRDLLEEDSTREATLRAGAQILRRRRHWRAARQGAAVLAVVAIVAVLALRKETPRTSRFAAVTPKAPPAAPVHEMTDDELLALFPNSHVALVPVLDGKKRLFFLRPGDEQRLFKRL